MFKLTPREQKLVILLVFLLILGVVFRFALPEQRSAGDPRDGEYDKISITGNPTTGAGQENDCPLKTVERELIVVHVAGEVLHPGVYTLEEGSRVYEAVEAAGGCLEDAARNRINLAQPLLDGQQVYIPGVLAEGAGVDPGDASGQGGTFSVSGKVNINTATLSQLKTLPGIGEVKAQNILSYRQENGLFRSIDDLLEVSGIGEKTLEGMRDLVTIY